MKTIQINLGLNNNPMNAEQLENYFNESNGYRLIAHYVKDMLFNNEVEPTFIALLECNYARQSKIVSDFENLCSLFNQQSIAISTEYMEFLAFNINYTGNGYLFNPDLFEYILN